MTHIPGVAGQKKESPASDSRKGSNMLSTQVKDKSIPDGWSRSSDGTLKMPGITAFQLFGALLAGEVPAYAANLAIKAAMSFTDFLSTNAIEIEEGEAS